MKLCSLTKTIFAILILTIFNGNIMAQPWSFTVTNSNHTIILLNDSNNYTINGQAIETGDYIGIFHEDANGDLACAGYFSWYDFAPNNASMAAYGAYTIDNGFDQGEEFVWKIWQASTNTVFMAEATYNNTLPDGGFFNENGLSLLSSLVATSQLSSAPWSYTITNSNHLVILLNDASSYLIDNQPIQPGDFIGAFYEDSQGSLACGGYFEWYYFTPNNESMAAYGAFEIDNGFQPGEEFSWKMWRASDSTEMDAVAVYNQTLPDQEFFNVNGFSLLQSLTAVSFCDTPLVTNHPSNLALCEGESHTFSITASGLAPLTYTWFKDGINTGSTGSTYTINPITNSDAGNYFCVVSNSCSSDTSDVALLTVNSLPIVLISGSNPICDGDLSILYAGSFNSYNWSTGESTQTINASVQGDYSVTVTDSNGCENSDTYLLTVNPNPIVTLGNDISICEGESVTLDAGNYTSFIWSTGATTQTISVSLAGSYSVTATNSNGCEGSDEIIVSINPNPVVDLGSDISICDGESVTLDAGNFTSFIWSTGATTQTISVSLAGNYSVTATNSNGCEGSDEIIISINPNPTVNLGSDVSICDGESVTLDAGNYTSFIWSTGVTTQTITVSTADSYSVTATNSNGCEGSDEIVVTVNSNPVIDLGNDISICEGETLALDAGNFTSFIWSTGVTTQTITVSTTGSYSVTATNSNGCEGSDEIVITVNPNSTVNLGSDISICDSESVTLDAGNYTSFIWSTGVTTQTITVSTADSYSVTATNSYGCEGSDEIVVTVNSNPVVDLGNDISICEGESVTLDAGNYTSFIWSTGATTQTISVSLAGSYSVTATNSNGCEGSDEIIISINPNPTVNLGSDISICDGESVILDAGSFTSFIWSTGATTQTISVSLAGSYSVTATNSNGCEGSDEIIISINPNPTVNLGSDVSICDGETLTLDAGNYTSFIWSIGATTQTISVSLAGNYSVTATNSNGCEGSDEIVITVNPNFTVNLGSDISICDGESVTLDAGSFTSFIWSTGATTQTITVSLAGNYSVTATNSNGCEGSDEIVISINPNPTVNLGSDISICDGESVTLDAGNYTSFIWSTSETTQTISVSLAGSYSVTATNSNGCEGSDEIVITVNSNPVVDLGNDISICDGESVTLDAGNYTSFIWSIGATTQTISVSLAGNYSVTATNSNGCEGSDEIVITVNPNFTVNLGSDISICEGESVTLDAGNYTSFIWSTGATTQTITVSTTGSYSVTATNSTGCEGSDEIIISVNPNPTVTLGNDISICDGEILTLDAGNYTSFIWSTGATTQTISVSLAGNYSVTATNSNGCEGSDEIVITVNSNPTVNLGSDVSICDGESVTLDAGNYTSFIWSTGATTQTISVSLAGSYSVTATNSNGCEGSDEIIISINPNPTVNLGSDISICDGETLTLDAGNYTSFIWSTGATTQTISVSLAGNYSVTATNSNGCEGFDEIIISINPNPTVNLGSDVSICDGESVTLDAGNYTSFIWSTSETTQTISVSLAGNYSVTATNSNGCEGSDIIVVTVNSNPVVDLGNDISICDGESVTLDAGNFTSFIWSTGETTQTISVSTADSYSVTATNSNGCEGSDEIIISINPNPTVNLGNDISICDGETLTLDAGNYTSFIWSTGATTQTISVSLAGNYSVTATNSNGCEGSDEIVVTVNSNPVVDLGNDISICEGESVTLDAGNYTLFIWSTGATTQTISVSTTDSYSVTATNSNGCEGSDVIVVTVNSNPTVDLGNDISICDGESVILDAGNLTSFIWSTGETTQTITVSTTGSYSVTATNSTGCEGSDEIIISINPNPTVNLGSDISICDGESVTLDAGNYTSFIWSTGATTQTISVSTTDSYSVTATNSNGCEGSDVIVVTVNSNPTVDLGNDISICDGESVTLDAGNFTSFIWSTGATTQTISVSLAGNYSVTATNSNGCEGSDEIVVTDDTITPTMDCPVALSAICSISEQNTYNNYSEFLSAGGSSIDNCGINENTFMFQSALSDNGNCPEVVTRTYYIEDTNGNSITCEQTITINDEIAPTFASAPQNITVDCIDDVPTMTDLAWTDNCDGNGIVTGSDASDGQTCPITITRTWSYTDNCGNPASATQTITVDDDTAPTMSCPNSLTAICSINEQPVYTYSEFISAGGSTSDNCGIDESSFVLQLEQSDNGSCPEIVTRTYYIEDNCDNSITCEQIITINDEIAPTFASAPQNITVDCIDDVPTMTDLAWTDNCDGNGTVTGSDASDGQTCPITITRTWSYTDNCGNPASVTQTITVDDDTAPIMSCPNSLTAICSINEQPVYTYSEFISAGGSTSDNCGIDESSFVLQLEESDNSSCPEVITRTYYIEDNCDNSITCEQIITIHDNIVPVFNLVPTNLSVECDGNGNLTEYMLWLDSHGGALATDNCSTVSWSYDETYIPGCGNTGSYYVIFSVEDDCGNINSVAATYTIVDTELPIAISQSVIVELNSNGEAIILTSDINNGSYDNCSGIYDMWLDKYDFYCSDLGNNSILFTVEDNCGLINDISAIVTVIDNISPIAICQDIDIYLDINGLSTITANNVNGGSFDNCDYGLAIDISTFDCTDVGVNQILLTLTDVSGNTDNCFANVTIIDNVLPQIICPDDIDMAICSQDSTLIINAPSVIEACGFIVEDDYGLIDNGNGTFTGSFHAGNTEIVWTLTDASQNVSYCVQVINLTAIVPTTILSNSPVCEGDILEFFGLPYEIVCETNCDLPSGYCMSGANLGFYQYIDMVELEDSVNLSSFSGYASYTDSIFKTLYIDSTYSLNIHITNLYNFTHYTHVFVDWNRDGDFIDADEVQTLGTALGSVQVTGAVTVPAGAVLGETLLRIVSNLDPVANSCGIYQKGETEDYLIEVRDLDHSMIVSYNWSGPLGWSSQTQYSEITNSVSGNSGMYYLTVTDIYGCDAITQYEAIVSDPQVLFDVNPIYTMIPETLILDPGIFDTYNWSTGAISQTVNATGYGIYEVTVTEYGCTDVGNVLIGEAQDVPLDEGWSIWSTYINNTDPIDVVMSDVVSDIIIVKDEFGSVYWPLGFGVNTIGNLQIGEAYLTKMQTSNILYVPGSHVDPTAFSIYLPDYYSYLGYLRTSEAAVSDIFSSIVTDLFLIKDDMGNNYFPVFNVNQIGNMIPGEGYKVRMFNSSTLIYGANTIAYSKSNVFIDQPFYFNNPEVSGSDMTIGIPLTSWSVMPNIGDEIAIFDSRNYLVGSAVFTGENIAMSVWGDDDYTNLKNGMSDNERLIFEIYNRNSGSVDQLNIINWIQGDGKYHENSVAIVGKIGSVIETSFLEVTNYPNPFTDNTTIEFNLLQEGKIELSLYDALGKKIRIIDDKVYPEGKNMIQLDVAGIIPGNYFVKLEAGEHVMLTPIQVVD